MSTYQWLLVFHVTGAFLLLGGGAIAAALNLSALGRERPSEIVLLFGLIRIAVVAITAGTALAFVFGLWLVHEAGYGYVDGWVIAAIVLLIVGQRDRRDRRQARPGDRQAGTRARRLGRRSERGAEGPGPRPDLARAQLRQRPAS